MRSPRTTVWMTPPALLLAGGFALGIVLSQMIPAVPLLGWSAAAGVCMSVGVAGLWWRQRRLVSLGPLVIVLAAGGCVVALGGAWHRVGQQLPPNHFVHAFPPESNPEGAPTLIGRVIDAPDRDERGIRFTLALEGIVRGADTLRVTGRVRAGLWHSPWGEQQAYPAIRQGTALHLDGTLEPLPIRLNPADFDYGAYLQRRGIYGLVNVYERDAVAVDDRIAPHPITRGIASARDYVRRHIQRRVPHVEAQHVLQALLLGDRSGISEATEERFARTGLMHLLAISGLHVLLIGMVLYGLLRPLLMRLGWAWRRVEWTRAALTMLLLVFYMVLTGGRPSVVRAVVMAGLFIGGTLLQRPTYSLNTLGVAALVLLIARPAALFDAGFQLSFAAVGSIVTLMPPLRRLLPNRWLAWRIAERPIMIVLVSVAATLGTMPVLIYHFGYASLAGLVLNVAAIPLTALLMTAGIALCVTGGWAAFPADLFGHAASLFAAGLLHTAETGHTLLGEAVVTGSTSPWLIAAGIATVLVSIRWGRPRLRWRWLIGAVLFASLELWSSVFREEAAPRMDVLHFSVGHGDAALLSLPNGAHMLIDAGPRTPFSDAGKRTILPHLERHGIDHLDAVVISHTDGDHLGGLPSLLRFVSIGTVVHNGREEDTDLYREVTHLLDSLKVPHRAVQSGDTLALDPSVRVDVLAPNSGRGLVSDNDASVVLSVTFGSTRFLFAGDIEQAGEEMLVSRYRGLASDVVKVPHHGSKTSSTKSFVDAVIGDSIRHPTRAVISVGRGNRFGLPDARVVQRWQERSARVDVTGNGAVWLQSDGVRVTEIEWQ